LIHQKKKEIMIFVARESKDDTKTAPVMNARANLTKHFSCMSIRGQEQVEGLCREMYALSRHFEK
jgi:hypothetical protein